MPYEHRQVVWLTGLSGAGKSTVAACLIRRLQALKISTCLLDGDDLRQGPHQDLGFSPADRREHIRRTAHLARLLRHQGHQVLVALISPLREDRDMARQIITPAGMLEVYVDTPLEVCMSRDSKGLYVQARQQKLTQMSGMDSPYQAPLQPDFRIDHEQPLAPQVDLLMRSMLHSQIIETHDSAPLSASTLWNLDDDPA